MSNLATLTFHGMLFGQEVTSSLNYRVVTGADNPDRMTKFVSAAYTALQPTWCGMLSKQYELHQLSARDPVRAEHNPSYKLTTPDPGTIDDQSLPSSQAGVIRFIQVDDTSRNNGRIYYCGIPEGAVVDQRLSNAYLTTSVTPFKTALETNIIDGDGVEYMLVTLTKDRDNHPPNPPQDHDVVEIVLLNHLITQRRRLTDILAVEAP